MACSTDPRGTHALPSTKGTL